VGNTKMLIPVYWESSSAHNCVNHNKPLLINQMGAHLFCQIVI